MDKILSESEIEMTTLGTLNMNNLQTQNQHYKTDNKITMPIHFIV